MKKLLAVGLMMGLLPLSSLTLQAQPQQQGGPGSQAMQQQMLSDEHLERMETHMEEMLRRVREMRATDDMEERRRLMQEHHQTMREQMRGREGMMMCPHCPMMKDGQHGHGGMMQQRQ